MDKGSAKYNKAGQYERHDNILNTSDTDKMSDIAFSSFPFVTIEVILGKKHRI